MPPRNRELPEGTDHIINGAMETGAGTSASMGSSGAGGLSAGGGSTGSGTTGGGSSSGFIGGSSTSVLGDDTGGTTAGGGTGGRSGGGGDFGGGSGGDHGGGSGSDGEPGGRRAVNQLKTGAQDLREQATSKVREYAEDGKSRATTALDDFSNVLRDTAGQIDERLGEEYGQYARRAADSLQSFADTVRNKDVDTLFDDAREVVRKSPVVAIGTAAAIGFALVRLVKAGMPDKENDVDFTPDPKLGGTAATGSQAPAVTPRTEA